MPQSNTGLQSCGWHCHIRWPLQAAPVVACRRALAGSASDSITARLHKFRLQGEGADSVRFCIWDTMGWRPAGGEAHLAAYAALLEGRMPHGADMSQPLADEGWEVRACPHVYSSPTQQP